MLALNATTHIAVSSNTWTSVVVMDGTVMGHRVSFLFAELLLMTSDFSAHSAVPSATDPEMDGPL
jgi:hypothetical protein